MAAIFPPADRGGVPPGTNVVNGYSPVHSVIGEGPLYVSPDCSTVLTDGQLNAISSEVLAAVDELGFAYNSSRIDNLGQALGQRFTTTDNAVAAKVDRAGDTMIGALALAADPVSDDEAANKHYVDTQDDNLDQVLRSYIDGGFSTLIGTTQNAIADIDARKVNRTGDQMSGPLLLVANPTVNLEAATKGYVDQLALEGGHFVDGPHDGLSYGRINGAWDGVVSVDTDQTALLSSTQQETARHNIGITIPAPYSGRLYFNSATSLILRQFKGADLRIAGIIHQIPAIGVMVDNSGLSANTLYYIYAYVDTQVAMHLEASIAKPALDETPGNMGTVVKTGDTSRSLVGMGYTNSSAQFFDTPTTRGVASYFNRARQTLTGAVVPNALTQSPTFVEANSAARMYFVAWEGEVIDAHMTGWCQQTVIGAYAQFGIALDNTTNTIGGPAAYQPASHDNDLAVGFSASAGVAEGWHYVTMIFSIASTSYGGTMTLQAQMTGSVGG